MIMTTSFLLKIICNKTSLRGNTTHVLKYFVSESTLPFARDEDSEILWDWMQSSGHWEDLLLAGSPPCSHRRKSRQEVTPCLNYLYLSSISHNSSETRSSFSLQFGEERKGPSSLKGSHKNSLLQVHEDMDDICPSIWAFLSSQALSALAERYFDLIQQHTCKRGKGSRDDGFLFCLHQLCLCFPHKTLYWNTL